MEENKNPHLRKIDVSKEEAALELERLTHLMMWSYQYGFMEAQSKLMEEKADFTKFQKSLLDKMKESGYLE